MEMLIISLHFIDMLAYYSTYCGPDFSNALDKIDTQKFNVGCALHSVAFPILHSL